MRDGREVKYEGPKQLCHHTITVDPDARKVYLFGGSNCPDSTNHLFQKFDLDTGIWSLIEDLRNNTNIDPREDHSACLIPRYKMLVVFGGFLNGERSGDTLLYSIRDNTWTCLKPTEETPCARSGHSVVEYRDQMYIFGGRD